MIKQYRIRDFDFKLVILVIALTLIGIFAVGSADESLAEDTDCRIYFRAFPYGRHFFFRLFCTD